MSKEPSFMELVEIHERRWGIRQYPGRPSLKDIMELPIVAVWASKTNFIFACFNSAEEVHQSITGMITGAIPNPDHRVLARIYYRRQRLDFTLQVVQTKAGPQPIARHEVDIEIQTSDDPGYVLPGLSDVSRGATYRPKKVRRDDISQPEVIDVNPQRVPRIVEAGEPRYVGNAAILRPPLRARNEKRSGDSREWIGRKK